MNYLGKCQKLYDDKLKAQFGNPVGCQEAELMLFELKHDLQVPKSYRQYLLWMGEDIFGPFQGSDWFFKDINSNTECLDELLIENGQVIQHAGKPLCFFSHQGYMSAWFYFPSKSEDPPCFFYSEADERDFIVEYETFSDFLFKELSGIVSAIHNRGFR